MNRTRSYLKFMFSMVPFRLAVLTVLLVGAASTVATPQDTEAGEPPVTAHEHPASQDPGSCTPSPQEQAAADALIADTTAALDAFPTPEAAEAAGYVSFGRRAPDDGPERNGTWHFINWSYRNDDAILDPGKIEVIMFGRTPDGGVHVIGGMYLMPRGQQGPQPGGCLTTWHTHTFGSFTTAEMLHVYTVELSVGPFASQGSPYYACEVLNRVGIGSGYVVVPPDCEPQSFSARD